MELWTLLALIAPDTDMYAIKGLYYTAQECIEARVENTDECWPADLVVYIPEDTFAEIIRPSYDY